jgi:hypothetical protein
MENNITFTRINNDVNGNPRYVVHFLALITEQESNSTPNDWNRIRSLYNLALDKSRAFGGKKYRAKSYGGGIVFQSYNLREDLNIINEKLGMDYTGYIID